MKTITKLLLLLFLCPLAGRAQITVTQADLPSVGDSWIQYNDNRTGVHTITAGGANQSWNYANSFVVADTFASTFTSPSATPAGWSAAFPNANLASYDPADSAAVFFVKNSNGLFLDGVYVDTTGSGAGISPKLDYNPNLTYIPTPFTMGSTNTSLARLQMEFMSQGLQIRYVLYQSQVMAADAWGSVTTPAGAFQNTLRVRNFSYSYDSVYAATPFGYIPISNSGPQDTSVTYMWVRNGNPLILMQISEDPFNPGTSTGAAYFEATPTVGRPEAVAADAGVVVYPNPARNSLVNFLLPDDKAEKLEVYTLTGQRVLSQNASGLSKLSFQSSRFGAGTYLYSLRGKDGQTIHSGRFTVQQ